ncbi:MAG: response regulator [Halobacteriota archaeon]|nr:response regulator [Halobacteriota archaeon]
MKKIMIVDDMPDIVDMVKHILESEGYETMEAYSGRECLEKVRKEKPDLILLDIMMKPLDGWQTLNELKNDEELKSIPISMLTVVLLTPEIMKNKPIEKIENYILKPFSKEGLIKNVEDMLEENDDIHKMADQLIETIGSELTEEYERLAMTVNRHRRLMDVIVKSSKTEFVESESVSNVLKSQERMVEFAEKRMAEIEMMASQKIKR